MPLISLQEAREHLEIPDAAEDVALQDFIDRVMASIQSGLNVNYWAGAVALSIYSDQADATAASVTVDSTKVSLTITGGAKDGTIEVDYATYDTLTKIVAQIEAQTGWAASLIGSGAIVSNLLMEIAATTAFGIANILRLDYALTHTEYYDGKRESAIFDRLYLGWNPVTSVTSLHDDTAREYGSDTLLDEDDDYVVLDSGPQLDGFTFNKGWRNIKIVYQGGFTNATRPDALVIAMLRAMSYLWNRRKAEHISSDNVQEINLARSFIIELPMDIKNGFGNYRRLTV
jgi:hypothetical protein